MSDSSGSLTVDTVDDANRRLFLFSIAYTFQGILGSFDTSQFGLIATPLVWVFWTLHMLFNQIVMLNLLISIIGSTFGRVAD